MTVHVVVLRGCGTRPLAHYLKALGVFRLVAEQRDADARAFWKDDVFHLATALDEAALVKFVSDDFQPTPLLSPWNGGSGFYPKDNRAAIDALAASSSPRFAEYRRAITACRQLVGSHDERPADEAKDAFLSVCQRSWSEPELAWLSAAVSVTREGEGRYPALLGTGGNDGRLDFTNNFMQRLTELIDLHTGQATAAARSSAASALFGVPDRGTTSAAIGQFHPGAAGGANGAAGFDASALFNPWDYVLALEGATVLRVAALRRLDGSQLPLAGAPFAFHGLPGGYGSATDADDEGRGEQWMPLWSAPATFAEVQKLFAEGRLVAGPDRPRGALDAARAVAQLGAARGVAAFERYGFMVRNGLSNLAVPLTRVPTREQPDGSVRLLDELDRWLVALRGASGDSHAPPSITRAWRRLQAALFDLCVQSHPGPRDWCSVVEELGVAEDAIVRSARFAAARRLRPLPRLSERWLDVVDDGSTEVRLAIALASAHAPHRLGRPDTLGPLRSHALPLEGPRFEEFASSDDALRDDPRVVWTGGDFALALSRVVLRRAMESLQAGYDGLAIAGPRPAALDDIAAFVSAAADDARVARLARGLMSVHGITEREPRPGRSLPVFALFRIANLDASDATRRVRADVRARCDLQTLRLLAAGRLDEAARVAVLRLGASGLRPKIRRAAGARDLSVRLLASLAFPIGPRAVAAAFDAITKPLDVHLVTSEKT